MPIVSFACKHTQALFEGHHVQRLSGIRGVAERKLQQLDAAETLAFLRSPPGNRLEKLLGERAGQHSLRINDQWRICFVWTTRGPSHVEIVDYH